MTCGQKIEEAAKFCAYCGASAALEAPTGLGAQPQPRTVNPTENTLPLTGVPLTDAPPTNTLPPTNVLQPSPLYQQPLQQIAQPHLGAPAQEASAKKKKWPLFLLIGMLVLLLTGAGVVAWYLISHNNNDNNNGNDALSSSIQDNNDKGDIVLLDSETCKITLGSGAGKSNQGLFKIEAIVENKTNQESIIAFDADTTFDGIDSDAYVLAAFLTEDKTSRFAAKSTTACELQILVDSDSKKIENLKGTVLVIDANTYKTIDSYPFKAKSIVIK